MLKIWAKTMSGDKITRDTIYKRFEKYDSSKLWDYITEICHDFDIPTPVLLKHHESNFNTFNIVRFKLVDFVESIDFDVFVLENASE